MARPGDWVDQEILAPSTVPGIDSGGALVPRPVILRTFAVADETAGGVPGHEFRLLPGGLTRAGTDPETAVLSGRGGSTSKDTWVVTSEPAFQQSPWLPSAPTEARPVIMPDLPAALPGCVTAQLFVFGRSAKHTEHVIRLIRTVLARLDLPLGAGDDGGAQSLQVLLSALGAASGFDPGTEPGVPVAATTPTMAEGVLPNDRTALALLFDQGVTGSLVSTLGILVEASYSVREQLSADTWQLIGDIE